MKRKGLLLGLMILVLGCSSVSDIFDDDGCSDNDVTDWRCDDNRVQICGVDGWETHRNCTVIGETCYDPFTSQCGGSEFPCCQ